MASTTTNLGLTKPAYSDDADISDINGNMDLIDAEAGRVRANVAANYDSSETYAVGDYCLHDGSLYKCNTTISSPEAWTAGHWTQIKITGELSALNGKIAKTTGTAEVPSGVTVSYIKVEKINKIVWFHFLGSKSQWAEGDIVCTLPSGYRPSVAIHTFATNYNMPSDNVQIGIGTDGKVVIWNKGVQPQGNIYIDVTYFVD